MKRLRLIFAINHFKSLALGGDHVSGDHQTSQLFRLILADPTLGGLTEPTWRNWFLEPPRSPQPGKIASLDSFAKALGLKDETEGGVRCELPEGFYSELVHHGLMDALIKPTKAAKPLHVLAVRAMDYEPLSPIHMHFDAIEVASWADNFEGVPWDKVTVLAATRLLEVLSERWSIRQGYLYDTFSSELRRRWDTATPSEQKKIRQWYVQYSPDEFEPLMQAGARPNWGKVGCAYDIAPDHIYKLLFGLGADTNFLINDRLSAWALDLATASLAVHALACTNRFLRIDYSMTEESTFWWACRRIFFDAAPLCLDEGFVGIAMAHSNASWSDKSLEVFGAARDIYRRLLARGGLSAEQVLSIAMKARRTHRIKLS